MAGVLSENNELGKYWYWLKNKLQREDNFEASSITRQLKLKAQDGKYYKKLYLEKEDELK